MIARRLLLIGGVLFAGAYVYLTRATVTDSPADQIAGDIFQGINAVKKATTGWNESLVPEQYRAAIRSAETARNLPAGMLARLLYQESHYRPDIISGATRSKVGALGIAQFMPATAAELGINPLDPFQAIPAAAAYLVNIKRYLGVNASWAEVLAGYNWGMGYVKTRGIAAAPAETVTYYTSILSDIGYA